MALSAFRIITPTPARFERIGARLPSDPKQITLKKRDEEAGRIKGLVAATKEQHAELWQRCVDWAAEVSEAQRHAYAEMLESITPESVERELSRIFAQVEYECRYVQLLDALGAPHYDEKVESAVMSILETMEADNKILYRSSDRTESGEREIYPI
jgi:hypothetical protein